MTAIENFHSSISSTHIDLVHIPTGRICFAKSSNSHSNRSKHLTTNKSMISVSRRIEHRKHLLHRLILVNNIMCFLGLFGIILMIISNEIIFAIGTDKDTIVTWLIKLTISISTIILIALLLYYHKLDINLYCITNAFSNWRFVLTTMRIFQIIVEILICSIHPIPRSFHSNWQFNSTITTTTDPLPLTYTTTDVALSLPMFLRLYLLCRFMKFRSSLMHNSSSKSLGHLNQVSIDFFFLAKTYLESWPTRCLLIFCTSVLFICSWSIRACDYLPTREHVSMTDSMWLFITTFTTVGYGDFTPSSYCGRSITMISALIGTFATALLISVLAQKLILTRWEKYVYNFVLNLELAKKRRHQAANIIKFAVKVWYLRRKNKSKTLKFMKTQWRLFQSIRLVQEVKREQRQLTDNCYTLADLLILQRDGNFTAEKVVNDTNEMKISMEKIDKKFSDMDKTMIAIQNTLNRLLNKVQ